MPDAKTNQDASKEKGANVEKKKLVKAKKSLYSKSTKTLQPIFRAFKIFEFIFVVLVVFIVVRGGILAQLEEKAKAKKNKIYYKSFNKYFRGTVVKIKRRLPERKGGLRYACYRLKLIESNSRYYNPSKPKSEYFCVIDFPYAEVMARDYGDVKIGDTCFFNGTTDCLWTKVGNKKWRGQRPNIGRYAFLNSPYSTINKYDSLQLVWRRNFYPRKQRVSMEQLNYYWKLKCSKKRINKKMPDISKQFFYTYSNWEKYIEPVILARREQPYFYMIQVDEYQMPLDLDSLVKRYNGESLIWIKHRDKHKYFLNRQILTHKDAKKYLKFAKKKFDSDLSSKLEIRRLKNHASVNWFNSEVDEKAIRELPNVQVIPKPKSFVEYAWIILIFFTFLDAWAHQIMFSTELSKDKKFARGYHQYVIGLVVFCNIWLGMLGLGLTMGWVNSIVEFMYVKNNPIVIVSNVYLIMLVFGISRWIFMGGGAKIITRLHKKTVVIFDPLNTEDGIILIWSVYVVFAIIFVFSRLFF